MALFITLLAGLSIAIGGLVVVIAHGSRAVSHFSIAIAFGAMVALALSDLVPELAEIYGLDRLWAPLVFFVVGFALLKLLDKLVPHHHEDEPGREDDHDEGAIHIGIMTAIALSIHNVVEGMSIYALAATSPVQGGLYAFGIMLHNIPMGMLIFATLRQEKPVLKYTALSVVTFSTFIGGVIMVGVNAALPEMTIGAPLGIALGMIAYIVLMELLPRLVHDRPVWLSAVGVVLGFGLVCASALFA